MEKKKTLTLRFNGRERFHWAIKHRNGKCKLLLNRSPPASPPCLVVKMSNSLVPSVSPCFTPEKTGCYRGTKTFKERGGLNIDQERTGKKMFGHFCVTVSLGCLVPDQGPARNQHPLSSPLLFSLFPSLGLVGLIRNLHRCAAATETQEPAPSMGGSREAP